MLAALANDCASAGDIDFFLVNCSADARQRLRDVYEACREIAAADSVHRTLLVTRTAASITIFSSATPKCPPVQVVLHVYESVGQLLSRFDVACWSTPSPNSTGTTRDGGKLCGMGRVRWIVAARPSTAAIALSLSRRAAREP